MVCGVGCQMSGLSAVWCGAACFLTVLLLPLGESTGVFEVQLTSLINGWGLTHSGLCCSHHHHRHQQNVIKSSSSSSSSSSSFQSGLVPPNKPLLHQNGLIERNDDNDQLRPDDAGESSISSRSRSSSSSSSRKSNLPGEKEDKEEEQEQEENGEQEENWACQEECRTFLQVCLSHFQHPLPRDLSAAEGSSSSSSSSSSAGSRLCTFGSATSLVLGGNTLDPFGTWEERELVQGAIVDPATLVRIPFTFSWPEKYTLVVEAWHDEHGNRTTADRRHLIARAVEGGLLQPSTLWQNHTTSSVNTDLTFRFRVVCDSNYYGPGCDVLCRESDDPIIGHYGCDVDGSRVCLPGWEGESCDQAECNEECRSGHGFCVEPNRCRCRLGWRGVHCSQCQTFPDCLRGYCTQAWQCLCEPGWSGSLCNIDNFYCERYRPCENGGTCAYDAISNYTCSCPLGHGGFNCQHPVCYPGLCLNHGVCVMIGGVRTCRCRRGFEGDRCEHAQVSCGSLSCRNNGTCTRQGMHFRCLCRPGFTGSWCEEEIDECLSDPCKYGGVCRNRINGYHCQCTGGHAGRNCDLILDPCLGFKCFNLGTCITVGSGFSPRCLCRPEFSGQRCQTPLDPCVGIACLHGGTCLRTGSASFHCACANSYSGSVCQIPPPSVVCRDQPCLNGGSCRRTRSGVVMCACPAGFVGALCEEWREESSTAVDVVEEPDTTEQSLELGVVEEEEGGDTTTSSLTIRIGAVEEEDPGGGRWPRNFQAASCSVRVVASRTLLFLTSSLSGVLLLLMLVLRGTRSCFPSSPLLGLS